MQQKSMDEMLRKPVGQYFEDGKTEKTEGTRIAELEARMGSLEETVAKLTIKLEEMEK